MTYEELARRNRLNHELIEGQDLRLYDTLAGAMVAGTLCRSAISERGAYSLHKLLGMAQAAEMRSAICAAAVAGHIEPKATK